MKSQRVGLWCAILVLGITGLVIQGCGSTVYTCDTDSAGKAKEKNCGTKPDMSDGASGCSVYIVGLDGTCTGCGATEVKYRTGKYQTCTSTTDSTVLGSEAACSNAKCTNTCKEVTITGANCPGITDVIECDDTLSCGYVDPGASL